MSSANKKKARRFGARRRRTAQWITGQPARRKSKS